MYEKEEKKALSLCICWKKVKNRKNNSMKKSVGDERKKEIARGMRAAYFSGRLRNGTDDVRWFSKLAGRRREENQKI